MSYGKKVKATTRTNLDGACVLIQEMVQLVYSLLLACQWTLWSKCMPYGFDHFKKTWTVLLQARFWAEGKHYVILKTTSQGSGGSGRQVLLYS